MVNVPLIAALGVPLGLGQLMGLLTTKEATNWYLKKLKKPVWAPPAPLFPVIWTVLYAAMGYASYLVWSKGGWAAQSTALTWYVIQLVFNLAWQPIFFNGHAMKTALADVIALFVTAAITASHFLQVDEFAGKLFYPYLAWIAVAAALNYSVWKKNPMETSEPPARPDGGSYSTSPSASAAAPRPAPHRVVMPVLAPPHSHVFGSCAPRQRLQHVLPAQRGSMLACSTMRGPKATTCVGPSQQRGLMCRRGVSVMGRVHTLNAVFLR